MALTTWTTYQNSYPQKAQQLTQVLLCAKGIGANENYLLEVDPATGGLPTSATSPQGSAPSNASAFSDHAVTPVTTGAYVQIVASTTLATNKMLIFDSSGETLIMASGASGFETDLFYIFPGGLDMPMQIPAGPRLSVKALTGNATGGYLAINFLT
jgi:hypothetical protein